MVKEDKKTSGPSTTFTLILVIHECNWDLNKFYMIDFDSKGFLCE